MSSETILKPTLRFSGHETFACRTFWLKKGYDFVSSGHSFNSPEAVANLGVGKNMVTSIRFWMHSFGLLDQNDSLSDFAHIIFSEEKNGTSKGILGFDPFLEHIETLWILHYQLVSNEYASIYSLFFNAFRKQRFEFHEDHLKNFLFAHSDVSIKSEKTIQNDIRVLLSNYVFKKQKKDAIEDVSTILFSDLNLIETIERDLGDGKIWYNCGTKEQKSITADALLVCLLLSKKEGTISFQQLLNSKNSVGNIFCLGSEQLFKLLESIALSWEDIVFTEDADILTIQGLENVRLEDVMERIYGR